MDSIEYAAAVAANIDTAIKSSSRTRYSVAQGANIPRSTIDRRIASRGLSPFTVQEVKAIADELGTTATSLLAVYVTAEKVPA